MRVKAFGLLLGIFAWGLLLSACEPTKEELVGKGHAALAAGNLSEAMSLYDQALSKDPGLYDALWGKSQVFKKKNNLPKQAEVLEGLLKDPAHKKRGSVIREELEKNYRNQALQAKEAKDQEALLRKALGVDKKSKANGELYALLMNKAGGKARAADFKGARAIYLEAAGLRVSRKAVREAKSKAAEAAYGAFRAEYKPTFERLKPELLEEGLLDPKGEKFRVTVEVEPPGYRKDEDFEKNTQSAATLAAKSVLEGLTLKLAGREPLAEGARLPFDAYGQSEVTREAADWVKKNKTYGMTISVPVDDVFKRVFALRSSGKSPAARPAKAPEKKPAGAPAKAQAKKPTKP